MVPLKVHLPRHRLCWKLHFAMLTSRGKLHHCCPYRRSWNCNFAGFFMVLQAGPLPVLNGVITVMTPASKVISPQLPIYFRPFIRATHVIPFTTIGLGPTLDVVWWRVVSFFSLTFVFSSKKKQTNTSTLSCVFFTFYFFDTFMQTAKASKFRFSGGSES